MTRSTNLAGSWTEVVEGVHWRPDKDTLVAVVSYLAVVAAFFVAFQVFTTKLVAANFITFSIGLAGAGIAVPVLYTLFVRRQGLDDLGVTARALLPSLALSALLGWDTYRNTVATLDTVPTAAAIIPLLTMSLAVGLFEAVFFRGWLQLRFEAAFGIVPGLVLGALCYAAYHLGYGMTAAEMVFLFGYGLVFGAVFRLTRNVFVLWPFYTPVGGFYSNLKNGLTLPFEATYGFVIVIAIMGAILYFGIRWQRRLPGNPAGLER